VVKCPKCKSDDLFKPVIRDGWEYWICQPCGYEFKPDNREIKYALGVAAEECAELAQVFSKASRFGPDNVGPDFSATNKERILLEFHDILGCLKLLCDMGVFTDDELHIKRNWVEQKALKIKQMMKISRNKGWL
jgi:Zn ribbon nucleic-acid-binding protein